jgi:acyl dehydratase
MQRLCLEDLSVGQIFESRTQRVDAEAIKAFAREFDPQPFHLDAEAAKGTLFGGLAASGWHTAALTMRLIVESVPLEGGVIGSGGELAWPRPTKAGDSLRVVTEVLSLAPSRSKPDRGMITMRSTTLNQDGEAVQVFTPKVVVQRRPA